MNKSQNGLPYMALFLSFDVGVKFDRAVLFDREIHLISNAKFCAKANNDNNKK